MQFTKDSLNIDAAAEADRIQTFLKDTVQKRFRRRGAVVGISGGVDSAVVFALCVRTFGPERVIGLILPDQDSSPESEILARELAATFGVTPVKEDITAALEGFGCYRRRDEAVRRVFPEFDASKGYRSKIVLPQDLLETGSLNVFRVTVIGPDGREESRKLPLRDCLQIVAASNFKQRTRTAMLYYHAELNNYAVAGTANKNEHDQGFFVKYGDSGVDIKTIGHLYKTQIYQLAEHLGVPDGIRNRTPTTDTYSAPCTQEEFYFRLPFRTMDLLWYAQEQNVPVAQVAQVMGLSEIQVRRSFADFDAKRRVTAYLGCPPLGLEREPSPATGHATDRCTETVS
jgi:NAD+ synthase